MSKLAIPEEPEVIITIYGKPFHRRIGKITKTMLGFEDHGILTCNLTIDFGGSGQGAGGYALDNAPEEKFGERVPSAACGEWVAGILRAVGVSQWEDLRGETIYVYREGRGGVIRGISALSSAGHGGLFMFTEGT